MRAWFALLILFIVMPFGIAIAKDMSGRYCIVTESEWDQCIVLEKKSKNCAITMECWGRIGPLIRPEDKFKSIPCRYSVQGKRVRIEYQGVTDFLDSGVHDWQEFGWPGRSPGLKRVEPAPEGSLLHNTVYWKQPKEKYKLDPGPARVPFPLDR